MTKQTTNWYCDLCGQEITGDDIAECRSHDLNNTFCRDLCVVCKMAIEAIINLRNKGKENE